jgi:hypothetical protein
VLFAATPTLLCCLTYSFEITKRIRKSLFLTQQGHVLYLLLWTIVGMVALFAFAVLCLVYVGGTGGWIGFIAASFAILCIASTFIGMNAMKREGGK